MLAFLLTQQKEQDVKSNTATLALLQRVKSFHGTLDDSPLIASMHTLASLSALASSMA